MLPIFLEMNAIAVDCSACPVTDFRGLSLTKEEPGEPSKACVYPPGGPSLFLLRSCAQRGRAHSTTPRYSHVRDLDGGTAAPHRCLFQVLPISLTPQEVYTVN
ncbi:unnamed protein product [Discosporangium mesarthrocarpum]